MITPEYLLSYGATGEFGRFRAVAPLSCRRGDRAVVRSHRGLELAVLLCPATPGHAHFLPNTTVGQLLRLAGPEDEQRAKEMRTQAHRLFADARRLAAELLLPLEVLDVEVTLDGEQAIVHHLNWNEYDERDLVSALVKQYDLRVRLHSLRSEPVEEEEEHSCGRPNCGQEGGGGCGSCSSCGVKKEEVQTHFAALREQMEEQNRVPLL